MARKLELADLTPVPEREEKLDDLIGELEGVGDDECRNAAETCKLLKKMGFENIGSVIDAINSGQIVDRSLLVNICDSDFALNVSAHALVDAAKKALKRTNNSIN